MIKISVILPVIPNSLQTYQTVFNLLSQNLTEIEVLAAGDTSVGEWATLLPAETGNDPRLRIIDTKAITEGEIKNEAMEQSRGEYVTFVQAGDRLLPQMLSFLYAIAKRYNLEAAGCGYAYIQAQGGMPRPARQELECYLYEDFIALTKKAFENRFLDLVEKRQMYDCCTKIYSAEFLQQHGVMFPSLPHLCDRMFNLACALHLQNFAYINRPMYQHVIREDDQLQGPYCLQRFDIVSEYHRKLTETMQKWGKYNKRAAYRINYIYAESVVHCFSQMYDPICDLSMREKLLYIMRTVSEPQVQAAISTYNPEIPYSKSVIRLLRSNNPSLILAMAHGVNLAQTRFNRLFHQMRLHPVDEEIRKTKRN